MKRKITISIRGDDSDASTVHRVEAPRDATLIRVELPDGRWITVSVNSDNTFRIRASNSLTIEPHVSNDLSLIVRK